MFITFEGGEGSGKSTVAYEIRKRMSRIKQPAVLTREPGGVEIAERIRDVILDGRSKDMLVKTEVLLYAASRVEHIEKVIKPALDEGKVVLCDRFVDSSTIYQGMRGDSGGPLKVAEINRYVTDGLVPNITFFLDVHPEVALQRIEKNNREKNRFDEKELDFHYEVWYMYKALAKNEKKRFVVIDGDRPVEEVVEEVWEIIKEKMEKRGGKL